SRRLVRLCRAMEPVRVARNSSLSGMRAGFRMLTATRGNRVMGRSGGRLFVRQLPVGRKTILVILVNLAVLAGISVACEIGFRLFWKPKYQIQCQRWWVGSGMTSAGRKYWPESTYRIRSPEFDVQFMTNERGYRARPEPPKTQDPYRIAFVGDSFT